MSIKTLEAIRIKLIGRLASLNEKTLSPPISNLKGKVLHPVGNEDKRIELINRIFYMLLN